MKISRFIVTAALAVMALTACSDGGVKSPDFDSAPVALTVEVMPAASPATVALGESLQLKVSATCSAPPGSASSTTACDVGDGLGFTITPQDLASIDDALRLTGEAVGSVTVMATARGIQSAPLTINIGPPVVRGVVIRTASGSEEASVASGESATLVAYARFSNGVERIISDAAEVEVIWSVQTPNAAVTAVETSDAADRTRGPIATARTGAAGAGVVVARVVEAGTTMPVNDASGLPINDSIQILVGNAQPVALSHIQLADDDIPQPGETIPETFSLELQRTREFVAVATYSDGVNRVIDDTLVTWSIDAPTYATLNVATGEVTGVARGSSVVTGALKASVVTPGGARRTDTAALQVVDARCSTPARDDRYTAKGWSTPLLCLVCSTRDVAAVIDADDSNYATLHNYVALLGAETALNVTLKPAQPAMNTGPTPKPIGFLIGIDAGSFPVLNLGLLNQLYVTLHAADGDSALNAAARSGRGDGGSEMLHLDLLGLSLVPGLEAVAVSFTPPPNVSFRRIRLGSNAGVAEASLTQSVRVLNACVP